jgi:hypothetical protein
VISSKEQALFALSNESEAEALQAISKCKSEVEKKVKVVFEKLTAIHNDLVLVSSHGEDNKFKQSEAVEEFPNKVLYHKCVKLSATCSNLAKLANLVASSCIERLHSHTTSNELQTVE